MALTKLHGRQRLLKLAKFLRELPEEKFYFGDYVRDFDTEHNCGTVCCAIGWMPKVDPKNCKWVRHRTRYSCVAYGSTVEDNSWTDAWCKYFQISRAQFGYLFLPYNMGSDLTNNASTIQVAINIEEFVNANR